MLVEIRIAAVHGPASETEVKRVWERKGKTPQAGRDLWTGCARELPLGQASGRLQFNDREVIACQRVIDHIALDLASAVRARLEPAKWGRLIAANQDIERKRLLKDPVRGPRKLTAWAKHDWGYDLSVADAKSALGFEK